MGLSYERHPEPDMWRDISRRNLGYGVRHSAKLRIPSTYSRGAVLNLPACVMSAWSLLSAGFSGGAIYPLGWSVTLSPKISRSGAESSWDPDPPGFAIVAEFFNLTSSNFNHSRIEMELSARDDLSQGRQAWFPGLDPTVCLCRREPNAEE
jgi:hypothetical protein